MIEFEKIVNSKPHTKVVSGPEAFILYTSYGFPLDLTEKIAKERGFKVDIDSFNEEFQKHRIVSSKQKDDMNSHILSPTTIERLKNGYISENISIEPISITDSQEKYNWDPSNIENLSFKANILCIVKDDVIVDVNNIYSLACSTWH